MPDLTMVNTCDLSGKALLWAVDAIAGPVPRSAGQLQLPLAGPVIDEEVGEHLIQKHGMWIERGHGCPWLACLSGHPLDRQPGDTRAEAAGRALIHHTRGDQIKVPKELLL